MKTCQVAFKEWSVIVAALLEGRQTILLRKGGISEHEGRFTIESREFFLYPTKVHQNPESLIHGDQSQWIAATADHIGKDHVRLVAFASVEHYERVRDIDRIRALQSHHAWTESLIDQRFHWGNEDWLDVFVLRVFRLPKSIELKNDAQFAGCKSWIHLPEPLCLEGALPVIPEQIFRRTLQSILAALAKTGSRV